MTSRAALRARLRAYGATVSRDGSVLRLAPINGSPQVEYRVAPDGTISRRTAGGEWGLIDLWEQEHGVVAIWLTEPIRLGEARP